MYEMYFKNRLHFKNILQRVYQESSGGVFMAAKKEIELNTDEHTVRFEGLTLQLHPTIFQYLSNKKKVLVKDQQSVIQNALNVGILAAMQGRVYETVKLFNSEIHAEYSLLSTHMEVLENKLKTDNKFKTDLEENVVIALREHCSQQGYSDIIAETGTVGKDGNKTGDGLATIQVDASKQTKIPIEIKFASTYQTGEKRNITANKIRPSSDTMIAQLLESRKNRDGSYGIFVIDEELNPIDGPGIQYFPEVRGFMVTVNVLNNDYENLAMCYEVARKMAIAGRTSEQVDMGMLQFFVRDLVNLLGRQKFLKDQGAEIVKTLKTNQNKTLTEVEKILITLDTELKGLQEAMAWVEKCLESLLSNGELSAEEAFEMYTQKNAQIDYDAKKKEMTEFYKTLE